VAPCPPQEAQAFEQNPYFKQILLLRSWEELTKKTKAPTPPLTFFKSLILKHLASQNKLN